MTGVDRDDIVFFSLSNSLDGACRLRTLAKERKKNKRKIVYIDSNGNDSTVTVYDSFFHTWTATDTMDKLAMVYLGSPAYAPVISSFNAIQDESKIEAGTEILIPVLTENENQSRNRIYSLPEKMDCYGVDIAIDDTGDIVIENGKIKTVGGKDNLAQAIQNRLSTALNSRIRLTVYGIRNSIGDPMAIKSYLNASIQETLLNEPRIDSIENLIYRGDGDNLDVEIAYTDISGNKGTFTGRI